MPEAQSPEARPPKEWAASPGRKGVEKIRIKNYLTMSVLVSSVFISWLVINCDS